MADTEIGQVDDYFAHIGVAGIALTDTLSVGDRIRIKGHTTDFTQVVDSMQIEHESVQQAGQGQAIGVKVSERCRTGDSVFRVAG